jgi:hypothetical protein
MVPHVGHDYVFTKEQGAFQQKGRLVVQHVMPPAPGHELG